MEQVVVDRKPTSPIYPESKTTVVPVAPIYPDNKATTPVYPDSVGKPVKSTTPNVVAEKFIVVNNINKELINDKYVSEYPFNDLEAGHGFFVPNGPAQTTEQTRLHMNDEITKARNFYGNVEVDENGDEVWETVVVKTRSRNEDGTFTALQTNGKPLESATQLLRPHLICPRHYVTYPVVKDYDLGGHKAVSDGVFVARVA